MWIDQIAGTLVASSGWANYPPDHDYWYTPRFGASDSGVEVSEETALTYATVWACVTKIAKTVATLPVGLYERLEERGKKERPEHPLYSILHTQPNPEMSAIHFWQSMMLNTLLWGTGYSEIIRNRRGDEVRELWPLYTKDIKPTRDKAGNLVFEHRPAGQMVPDKIPAIRMFRTPGLSLNGITGLSPIGWQREAVGLGMAAKKSRARLHKNGSVVPFALKFPFELNQTGYERIKASWQDEHAGLDNVGKVAILEQGGDIVSLGINPKDAQWLEAEAKDAIVICGIFDTPPHKIGILDRASFSNIEEQQIQWIVDCIGVWCQIMASAINTQLLDPKGGIFAEFILMGILRGDIQRRYGAYAVGRQWGWLSANDIRRLENMNPIEEDGADNYLQPLNMVPLDEQQPKSPERIPAGEFHDEPEKDREDSAATALLQPIILDAAQRIVAKESNAVETAFKRRAKESTGQSFRTWLDKFYNEEQPPWIAAILAPLFDALWVLAGNNGNAPPRAAYGRNLKLPQAIASAAKQEIVGLLEANQAGRLPALLQEWRTSRPERLGGMILGAFQVNDD